MARRINNNPRSAAKVPIWNQHAFTCPGCGRHFQPITIRILKHQSRWHCHKCVLNATEARTQRVAGTPAPREGVCHTCHQPFGTRRAITNIDGNTVHYRCPPKR